MKVRTPEEYESAHIPGAVNRDAHLDLAPGPEGTYWDAVDALRERYEALGVTADRPVIVYCQSGHRATQTFYLLRYVLGHDNVLWYDGSWKAWGARGDLPVVRGEEPGGPRG